MKCVYTLHATQKMSLVGIQEKAVERIIESPKVIRYSIQNKEMLEYYGTLDSKHSLKVVLIKTDIEYRIITVILQKSSRDPINSNYIP